MKAERDQQEKKKGKGKKKKKKKPGDCLRFILFSTGPDFYFLMTIL